LCHRVFQLLLDQRRFPKTRKSQSNGEKQEETRTEKRRRMPRDGPPRYWALGNDRRLRFSVLGALRPWSPLLGREFENIAAFLASVGHKKTSRLEIAFEKGQLL
jgi:hypothetical protein